MATCQTQSVPGCYIPQSQHLRKCSLHPVAIWSRICRAIYFSPEKLQKGLIHHGASSNTPACGDSHTPAPQPAEQGPTSKLQTQSKCAKSPNGNGQIGDTLIKCHFLIQPPSRHRWRLSHPRQNFSTPGWVDTRAPHWDCRHPLTYFPNSIFKVRWAWTRTMALLPQSYVAMYLWG